MKDSKNSFWLAFCAIVFLLFPSCRESYNTKEESAKLFAEHSLSKPLLEFKIDVGRYPSQMEGIGILVNRPDSETHINWKGPYVIEIPLDPWGNRYQYVSPGIHNPNSYDLWSLGPDGVPSDDDIGNW
ncbi:hypothetical protein G0Q06_13100 [Puniceicoccales bacterium CK1056]|uniref:Type II secretion system protein GspG C-terminal domain-containing protein n=1 Tax=Oceanipulchritudo coccoides TaxID=2706888 RepID=A0A6B2M4W2_9BACT|nr:hypothetical protein [Oceanipulchritudo coccoides]